jgi:PAS domain-containing protein
MEAGEAPDPSARLVALGNAIRAVSEAASQDPTAVLEELARQAETLLGCDGASIHLAEATDDGEVVFRRVRVSEFGRVRGVEATPTWRADETVLAALRAGRVAFHQEFRAVTAHDAAERPWLREIASALYAPLVAADEPLGVLFAAWTRPRRADRELLLVAEALARCAAVAVHQARLLERSNRAHAELSAVFDAAEDAILIFDDRGRLVHVNRSGRERITASLGQVPDTADEMRAQAKAVPLAGSGPGSVVAAALQGENASATIEVRERDGTHQQLHIKAAPIRGEHERVRGAVVVVRNITELHDAIAESGRLDGAIKTARLVAHQLNNQLSPVRGYSELILDMTDGDARTFASRILRAADNASATVGRLQRIIRFEETDAGGYTMLDLDAAAPPEPVPPQK